MKLLIDIPEHIYEHAKETTEDSRDEFDAMRAIANGTQKESRSEIPNKSEIPTSCGDVISRQAAIEAIEALQRPIMREESNYYQFKFSGMSEAREAVVNLPSVTPQQRTGRWVWDSKSKVYRCSCCKRFPWRVEYVSDHDEIFEDLTRTNAYKYCPNCGAKMEVEE